MIHYWRRRLHWYRWFRKRQRTSRAENRSRSAAWQHSGRSVSR